MTSKQKKKIEKPLSKRNDKYKKELRERPTKAEEIVKSELERIKIKFCYQKGFYKVTGKLSGFHCIVDFYIKSLKLAIELDGEYHNDPIQVAKDNFRDSWLMGARGVNVLRIKNEDAGNVLAIINKFLENPPIRKNVHLKYWYEKYNLEILC